MSTDDAPSNLPASPQLKNYIDDLRARQSELGAEIRTLQTEEDRLRHDLAQEIRHRDLLRQNASGAADAGSVQALTAPQIIAADESVERLREELRAVRERLVGAERERDRLREQVSSLEDINTTTQDLVNLHYERAEFERRRFERSDEQVRSLRAQVAELERQLREAREVGVGAADANARADRGGWMRRLFGRRSGG